MVIVSTNFNTLHETFLKEWTPWNFDGFKKILGFQTLLWRFGRNSPEPLCSHWFVLLKSIVLHFFFFLIVIWIMNIGKFDEILVVRWFPVRNSDEILVFSGVKLDEIVFSCCRTENGHFGIGNMRNWEYPLPLFPVSPFFFPFLSSLRKIVRSFFKC